MFASLYLCNILSAYSQLPSGSGSVYNPGATAKVLDLFLLFRSDIKIGRGASSCPIPIGTPTYRRRASSVSSSSSGSWSAAVVRVTPPDPGICNFKLWQAPETRILAHVSVTGWLADQLLPTAPNCCCSQSTTVPFKHASPPHPAMLGQPHGIFFLNSYDQLPCRC
jgi:hypothetical protein